MQLKSVIGKKESLLIFSTYLVSIASFLKNFYIKGFIDDEVFTEHFVVLNILIFSKYFDLGMLTMSSYRNLNFDKFYLSWISKLFFIGFPLLITLVILVLMQGYSIQIVLPTAFFALNQLLFSLLTHIQKIWNNYKNSHVYMLLNIANIISVNADFITQKTLFTITLSALILVFIFIKYGFTRLSIKSLKLHGVEFIVISVLSQMLVVRFLIYIKESFGHNIASDILLLYTVFNFLLIIVNVINEAILIKGFVLKLKLSTHLFMNVTFVVLGMLSAGFIMNNLSVIDLSAFDYSPDLFSCGLFIIMLVIKNPIIDRALKIKLPKRFIFFLIAAVSVMYVGPSSLMTTLNITVLLLIIGLYYERKSYRSTSS